MSDDEFEFNLSSCDLLLMPYINCSGSALLSHAIAMKIPIICSKLNYFLNFEKRFYFVQTSNYNSYDFIKKFSKVIKIYENDETINYDLTKGLGMELYCKKLLKI